METYFWNNILKKQDRQKKNKNYISGPHDAQNRKSF